MDGEPRRKRSGREPEFVQMPMTVIRHFARLRRQETNRRRKQKIDSAQVTYSGLRSFRNYAKASDRFGKAIVSAGEIAERTGQSERTVIRNLPLLTRWGFIFRDPRRGAKAIITFNEDPTMFLRDAMEAGPERAKGKIERHLEQEKQKARGDIARKAARRKGLTAVSGRGDNGDRPPLTTVTRSPDNSVTPSIDLGVDLQVDMGNRAPSPDGASVSLSEHAGKDNTDGSDPRPSEANRIVAGLYGAIGKKPKTMPAARMTKDEEDARRRELEQQNALILAEAQEGAGR